MNKYTNKSGAVFTPLQTVGAVDGMLLQPAHLLHCTKAPPPALAIPSTLVAARVLIVPAGMPVANVRLSALV